MNMLDSMISPANFTGIREHYNLSGCTTSKRISDFLQIDNRDFTDQIYQNERYNLIVHGNYVKDGSILPHLGQDIEKYLREFINGLFVGILLDKAEMVYFIFNGFLCHLPLYYHTDADFLCFSTSVTWLARTIGARTKQENYIEYLHYGTHISETTAFEGVSCLSKGSYIKLSRNKTEIYRYYTCPSIDYTTKDFVDTAHNLWEKTVKQICLGDSIGLGLTGGVDSRLIIAEARKHCDVLTFTGSSTMDPDYLVANELSRKLGVKHIVEDYSHLSQIEMADSYVQFIIDHDNPLLISSFAVFEQYLWRKRNGVKLQIYGNGGETLGGEHYYYSRSSLSGLMDMAFNNRTKPFKHNEVKRIENLLFLACRGDGLVERDLSYMYNENSLKTEKERIYNYIEDDLLPQLGKIESEQDFLERVRAIYKYSNLLYYNYLPSRNHYNLISPFFSTTLVDFALRIPLGYRRDRKLMFQLMRDYYPEVCDTVLTGSFLTPKSPLWLYKTTKPFIKGMNKCGFRIPYYQWYIKKHYDPFSLEDNEAIVSFKKHIIQKNTNMNSISLTSKRKLNLLFAVSLNEIKAEMGDAYSDCITETWLKYRATL